MTCSLVRSLLGSFLVAGLLSAPPVAAQGRAGQLGKGTAATAPVDARSAAIAAIVAKWGPFVAETYQTEADQWASEMARLFANVSVETLQRAANRPTFTAMNDTLLGNDGTTAAADGSAAAPVAASRLGDMTLDLVFVPVTPCRIFDTRVAGGEIAAGAVRSFNVTGTLTYASQGGDNSDCGGAGQAGAFAAAALNLTVVTPSGGGYITAFPLQTTQPLAATLNYNAGDVRGNLSIVKLDQTTATHELSVYSFATTHLVGDIVGYFINPQATQFDCAETSRPLFTVNANTATFFTNPACPAGYKAVTPYCYTGASGVYSQGSGYVLNSATGETFCAWQNTTGVNQLVAGGNVCCRVPGR